MKRVLVLVGCLLALVLSSWSVLSQRGAVEEGEKELAALTSRKVAAAAAAERARERLTVVEGETAQLLDQIATLSRERRESVRAPSNQTIRERHTRAREFAERGAWPEALAEYLWCYDYAFLRSPALVKNFAQLATRYPPAAVELQVRLQAAEARARHDPSDTDALQDFTTLDLALNQSARSLAFHDELPANDERRVHIARALAPEFIARKRYTDVSAIIPRYEPTIQELETRLQRQSDAGRVKQLPPQNEAQRIADERARAAQFKAAIDSAMVTMEVLAGLGDSIRAQTIAEKILLLDTSPETRAVVASRLERAGFPSSPPPPTTTR